MDALAEILAVRYRIECKLAARGTATAMLLACLASVGCGDDGTGPSDTTRPTVELTAPADGATVTGTIKVTAAATDASGIEGVQFWLDFEELGPEDTEPPYEVEWNTGLAREGTHRLSAVARDGVGLTRTSFVARVEVEGSPGTLVVDVTMEGAGADPDGFSIFFNGFEGVPLEGPGSTTLSASQGPLEVSLENVSPFCEGAQPRTVVVPSGGTASVTFDLTCIEGPGGLLVYAGRRRSGSGGDLVTLDMTTGRRVVLLSRDADVPADLSPDGTKLAYIEDGSLHVAAADGSGAVAVAVLPENAFAPHWSPDGATLVFNADRGPVSDLYLIEATGADMRPLFADAAPDGNRGEAVWSTAGRLAYGAYGPEWDAGSIWTASPDGSGVEQLTDGVFDIAAAWSPDGSQLAFVRWPPPPAVAGMDVYIIGADGSGLRNVTGTGTPQWAVAWSPNAEWLAISRGTELVGVPVVGGRARLLDDDYSLYMRMRWVMP